EAIDAEKNHVGVKLLHAPPDEAEAAERLVSRERVAAGSLDIFHVAAEDRGKKSSQELRDRTDELSLVLHHVGRNACGLRLKESRSQRLAWSSARRKMRGGLGHLIGQRIEIEHLWIGVNRRNAVLIRLCLHIGENVVALLHLHQRIADTRAILTVAR